MKFQITRVLAAGVLALTAVVANATDFVAGKDYQIVKDSMERTPGEVGVDVVEFFNYGCPACHHFEPQLQTWLDEHASAVNFTRVPVIFRPAWQPYAVAYYAVDDLDLSVELDGPLFQQIGDNPASLSNNAAIIDFIVDKTSLDKSLVEETFASEGVAQQLATGKKLMRAYRINSVPSIVIAGIYKTDMGMVGSDMERLLAVMDHLLEKAKNT